MHWRDDSGDWLAEQVLAPAVQWLLRDAGADAGCLRLRGRRLPLRQELVGRESKAAAAQKKRVRSERAELLQPVDGSFRS
ncbi:MAG: hypothetical protein DMF18_10130 [Verrucomicrobia bacterium]|nr:MAG: hypothetical protein DMF18_10130 [Verrucomicrobiota bacterium]